MLEQKLQLRITKLLGHVINDRNGYNFIAHHCNWSSISLYEGGGGEFRDVFNLSWPSTKMLINSGSQTSDNDKSPLLQTDYHNMNNTAAISPDTITRHSTSRHASSRELVDDNLKSDEENNTATVDEPEKDSIDVGSTPKSFPYKKIILGLIIVAVITIIIVDSLTSKRIQSAFQSFLEWTADNIVVGFFAFIAVYAIATVLFIPGSILTLGSGFIFGNAVGNLGLGMVIASGAVFIGASLGAVGSFLVGRYLVREWVGRVLVEKYSLVKALDGGESVFGIVIYIKVSLLIPQKYFIHFSFLLLFIETKKTFTFTAIEQKGLRIFLLLRLSPIIPFNAINYIAGVTALSLKDYTLSLMGILPGTVVYCFIGAGAGSLAEGQNAASGNRTLTIVSIGKVE